MVFTSGFGPTEASVPPLLKHAIMLIATSLKYNKGDMDFDPISPAVENLLSKIPRAHLRRDDLLMAELPPYQPVAIGEFRYRVTFAVEKDVIDPTTKRSVRSYIETRAGPCRADPGRHPVFLGKLQHRERGDAHRLRALPHRLRTPTTA